MELSLSSNGLKQYLTRQLETFFPDGIGVSGKDVDKAFSLALERLEFCFREITFPSYSNENGQTFFSHMHADQYAQFLYYFSNTLWNQSQNRSVCDKVMYLNRILNNFFFSYKGKLPDVFFLAHPIGTVLGNAVYSDYLVVFQNVTVNTSSDSEGNPAPVLGKGLFLGAGSKIIGNMPIGDRVSIGVDTVVYNMAIPNDKVVITDYNGSVVVNDRKKELCMAQNYFRKRI